MLLLIAGILIMLWILGFAVFHVASFAIHFLILVAIAAVAIHFIRALAPKKKE